MKLYLASPESHANGGIRRVVEAQYQYLPEFGVEFVQDPAEAEVIAAHVTGEPLNPTAPFVLHNHGMYWSDYTFPHWAEKVNQDIVVSMRQAYAITSPSQWVTHAIQRGVYFDVRTIYHGIDSDKWTPGEPGDYILWNKARADDVSNPKDLNELARQMPQQEFWSTISVDRANVKHLGFLANNQMKQIVRNAGLYLCTARETFGIGTLEALACGVPVVGWDYGGQHEIVVNGETGYLAPYGDYAGLADCVRNALRDRRRLSRNAVDDVQKRWQWRDKMGQYARLYDESIAWFTAPRPKVSVVIPAHNLAKYLPYALNSVQKQTSQDFECLIVDDSSTDETPEIARMIVELDIRFRYIRTYENLGLSAVRNLGASKALGKYIIYLDADDMLPPNALDLLSDSLDQNRGIHIAYGSLELISEDGTHQRKNRFPGMFNWYYQMAHQNQIPTGAMMRREVIERSGGWRTRQWRAEDAEFWSRVTSFGYRAEKVTEETTLLYRVRADSKGSKEFRTYADRDGNWLANIPWRSANSAAEGIEYLERYGQTVPQPDMVPFGAQAYPPGNKFWRVPHYQSPEHIIIVSNGIDGRPVEDTLDSIVGLFNQSWKVYVVGGKKIEGFPYVEWVTTLGHIEGAHVVQAGEILPADFLGMPEALSLLPNDKVLLQYIGIQSGKVPYRVNGKIYYGQKGRTEWVDSANAVKLIARGHWKEIRPNYLPEIQPPDQRRG